ncbi:MAG: hypothetical protein IH944_01875 [Armatimonadetes bacterium]|nr:hypothetical protein [Armatimonadota bacterium]
MRKKRKVWWIVGGVGFVVLFMFAMLVMRVNSADAKMTATLEGLAARYGLEVFPLYAIRPPRFIGNVYQSPELSEADIDEILKTIDDACQDCAVRPRDRKFDDFGLKSFYTGDQYQSIQEITIVGKDAFEPHFKGQSSGILVARRTPTLVDRIKSWWPW